MRDGLSGETVTVDVATIAKVFARPRSDAHKYSRGVVLVDAGSRQFPGALQLAVSGARMGGAGMIRIPTRAPQSVLTVYPEVVCSDELDRVTAIVVGPGDAGDTESLHRYLMTDLPVVIDAGALNLLSDEEIAFDVQARGRDGKVTVLTPHEGEAIRLGVDRQPRVEWAKAIAMHFNALVVLKGAGTVIADATGRAVVDTYGTSALATAGSGDVLAGLIGSSLSAHRDLDPLLVVASAVALHGMAGRQAQASLGVIGASDLAPYIGQALLTVLDEEQ